MNEAFVGRPVEEFAQIPGAHVGIPGDLSEADFLFRVFFDEFPRPRDGIGFPAAGMENNMGGEIPQLPAEGLEQTDDRPVAGGRNDADRRPRVWEASARAGHAIPAGTRRDALARAGIEAVERRGTEFQQGDRPAFGPHRDRGAGESGETPRSPGPFQGIAQEPPVKPDAGLAGGFRSAQPTAGFVDEPCGRRAGVVGIGQKNFKTREPMQMFPVIPKELGGAQRLRQGQPGARI